MNFKKSRKQSTEFIALGEGIYVFIFVIYKNAATTVMLIYLHVLNITPLGKKFIATYKISKYKYSNFRNP